MTTYDIIKTLAFAAMILTVSFLLASCATPQTVLKSDNGQVAVCGGNRSSAIAGGIIGYHIQKSEDANCVETHKAAGFKIVEQSE